jgi:hypothetical protein
MSITNEIYESFQRSEFERWDQVLVQDVILDSPGRPAPFKGLNNLKFGQPNILSP